MLNYFETKFITIFKLNLHILSLYKTKIKTTLKIDLKKFQAKAMKLKFTKFEQTTNVNCQVYYERFT